MTLQNLYSREKNIGDEIIEPTIVLNRIIHNKELIVNVLTAKKRYLTKQLCLDLIKLGYMNVSQYKQLMKSKSNSYREVAYNIIDWIKAFLVYQSDKVKCRKCVNSLFKAVYQGIAHTIVKLSEIQV